MEGGKVRGPSRSVLRPQTEVYCSLEMANFLYTFSHDGIFRPSLFRIVGPCHPLSLYLSQRDGRGLSRILTHACSYLRKLRTVIYVPVTRTSATVYGFVRIAAEQLQARAGGMNRLSCASRAGSLSSSQPGGPPNWVSPLAFGLIALYCVDRLIWNLHKWRRLTQEKKTQFTNVGRLKQSQIFLLVFLKGKLTKALGIWGSIWKDMISDLQDENLLLSKEIWESICLISYREREICKPVLKTGFYSAWRNGVCLRIWTLCIVYSSMVAKYSTRISGKFAQAGKFVTHTHTHKTDTHTGTISWRLVKLCQQT